jgi:ATP-binding cassette subfamily B protein
MAFSTLVAHAVQPLDVLMGTWERLQKVRVHLDRIADVVDAEPEQVASVDKLLPVPHLTGAIEFRKMSFRYGGATAPWILKDISLTIPAGSRVAIVGRSGSGKTTLAKVLAGLLPATEGSVLFDGRDATLLHRRDLRRRLGFVLQADHIFSGSVLENIALGEEASWDRAVDAARLAAAHDFIAKLPMGYQTPIGEQGVGLSGGQRQRIAIARALYRNPSVLIFDEATSALDTESERMIQQNLGAMLQGRTSILIAHRLSTVRDADLIVVLDQGEIAEQGTHQELLERRGIYFQLVHRQVEE